MNDAPGDVFTVPTKNGFIVLFRKTSITDYLYFTNPAHGDKALMDGLRADIMAAPEFLIDILRAHGYVETELAAAEALWFVTGALRFLMERQPDTKVFRSSRNPVN